MCLRTHQSWVDTFPLGCQLGRGLPCSHRGLRGTANHIWSFLSYLCLIQKYHWIIGTSEKCSLHSEDSYLSKEREWELPFLSILVCRSMQKISDHFRAYLVFLELCCLTFKFIYFIIIIIGGDTRMCACTHMWCMHMPQYTGGNQTTTGWESALSFCLWDLPLPAEPSGSQWPFDISFPKPHLIFGFSQISVSQLCKP